MSIRNGISVVITALLICLVLAVGMATAVDMAASQVTADRSAVKAAPDSRDTRAITEPLVVKAPMTREPGESQATVCVGDWQGTPSTIFTMWFVGGELYASYQDPIETGCTNTYPFQVTQLLWVVSNLQTDSSLVLDMQPAVFGIDSITDPSCWLPDTANLLCAGPVYEVTLDPNPGGNQATLVGLPFDVECCMEGPYFITVLCPDSLGTGILGIVGDDGVEVAPRECATYNWYRNVGFEDLVVEYSFPSNLNLYSEGFNADSNGCAAAGACCLGDGTCVTLSEATCLQQGGTYFGDGTSCDPNPCTGACCLSNGTCLPTNIDDCTAQGGTFIGLGTDCDPYPCGGACCDDQGGCTTETEANCLAGGGTYMGDAVPCDPSPCSCCQGRTGDVNLVGTFPTEIDSSDLGELVNYLFSPPGTVTLVCEDEADVDAGGGPNPVDSSDLGALVNFLFAPPGQVTLPDCP